MRLFTELPMDEIARLEKLAGAELNAAKAILATEATALLHGRAAAEAAAKAAAGDSAEGLPVVIVPEIAEGMPAFALVARAFGLASNAEARRQIRGGGVRLNDAAVTDEGAMIGATALIEDGAARLSLGRKRQVLIRAS
jgi:tyrosyl-tRNA synthetase